MNSKIKPKIIVVLGPTAVGKSDLAVQIAKKFNGEIISADSRQVYKGMNLGSGKITKREMRGIRHHLLDVISPNYRNFTVADFQKKAYKIINSILAKNKLPIICGGTGFYIQSIVEGIIYPEIPIDKKLRTELNKLPLKNLQTNLKKIDPNRYKEIDTKNPARLIRAIEIANHLGVVPKIKKNPKYEAMQIGLKLPEQELIEKISKRLDKRLKKGMLKEAQNLHQNGLSWKRMEEMGLEYKYMAQFLQNKISKSDMIKLIKLKSQQFAKRQITWFKKDTRIKWFKKTQLDKIKKEIQKFLISKPH